MSAIKTVCITVLLYKKFYWDYKNTMKWFVKNTCLNLIVSLIIPELTQVENFTLNILYGTKLTCSSWKFVVMNLSQSILFLGIILDSSHYTEMEQVPLELWWDFFHTSLFTLLIYCTFI
jgi:hypothetical protein